jgi:hypothetical protein
MSLKKSKTITDKLVGRVKKFVKKIVQFFPLLESINLQLLLSEVKLEYKLNL